MKHCFMKYGWIGIFLAVVAVAEAAPFIDESFDREEYLSRWNTIETKPTIDEGFLVLKTPSDRAEAYVNSGLRSDSDSALNFTVQPIEIVLEDISIEGSAPQEDRFFKCVLRSDEEGGVAESLQLSVSGAGVVSLALHCRDGEEPRVNGLFGMEGELPIQRISLKIDRSYLFLQITDAAGVKERKYTWKEGDFHPEHWAGSEPQLLLIGSRRPSEGDVEVRIGKVTVERVPDGK